MDLVDNSVGGYAFIPGLPFASQGVRGLPGMAIEHVTLLEPITLPDGLDAIRRFLEARKRPIQAACGLELRMPDALSLGDFVSLNIEYLSHLDSFGLLRDAASPLARTNVVPVAAAPANVVIAAFSYTMPAEREEATLQGATLCNGQRVLTRGQALDVRRRPILRALVRAGRGTHRSAG